jgi:hypothetical protein
MIRRHMIYNLSQLFVYDHILVNALGNLLFSIADNRSMRLHEEEFKKYD